MPPKFIGSHISIGTIVFLIFLMSICLSVFIKKPRVEDLPKPPPPSPVMVCPPCECLCPEPFNPPDAELPQTTLEDVKEALRPKANQRRK